jgi:lysophospholipase
MGAAPYFHDVADGPGAAEVRWLAAEDGVRLRAAAWAGDDAGTVLLFSGRTEYVEKYSRVAGYLVDRGFSVVTADWRGQGLSDRALPDALTGHIADFADYQLDVAALRAFALSLELPRPFHLIGHSMGGCIGLRALHRGLDVDSVVFSAPMWGIEMSPMTRPIAWSVSWIGRALGHGSRYTPGTSAAPYVAATAFDANQLTTDAGTFEWMQTQTREHPELSLGGPSLSWLFAALREMRGLRSLRPPPYPAKAFVGSEEAIVEPGAIRSVMRRWPGSGLEVMQGAKHELMMERPPTRERFLEAAVAHFTAASEPRAA